MNNNISIILPIIDASNNEKDILKAIKSIDSRIDSDNIIVVCGIDDYDSINNIIIENGIKCRIVKNEGSTDFCSQINYAVKYCKTEFFSILEMDDEYTNIWFDNMMKYSSKMPDVDVFLNLCDLTDYDTNKKISLLNEIIWANSFSNEIGVIDFDCLENYYDFHVNGSIIRTNEFINLGGLKPSLKIFFWHEFLLRATSKGFKIYVIPKIGYCHYINRKGSLMNAYENEINEEEAKGWLDLAKIEYSFKEDRNKKPLINKKNEINELK